MKILNTLLIIYFFCTLARAGQPNFLIIDLDDNKLAGLDYTESVPNMEAFRQKSLSLSNFYSPTSGAFVVELLTGKYPATVKNVALGGDVEEPCVADTLKKEGYASAYIGKWRNAKSAKGYPSALGFDFFYGILDNDSKWPYEWQMKAVKAGKLSEAGIKEPKLSLIFNSNIIEISAKQKDFAENFTKEALDFVNNSLEQNKPFFIYLNYASSYSKAVGVEYFFPSEDKLLIKEYYKEMDTSFAKILKSLERKELLDDTVIILLSKSGFKAIRANDNAKNTAPESKHKMSAFIYYPKLFKEPKCLEGVASTMDIYAFILDIAKGGEGESILGYFLGKHSCNDSPILYYSMYKEVLAMRAGNFKVVLDRKSSKDSELQLYELSKDPLEMHNLAESMPEKAKELKQKAKYLDYKQPKILSKAELEKKEKYEKAKAKELEKQKAKEQNSDSEKKKKLEKEAKKAAKKSAEK